MKAFLIILFISGLTISLAAQNITTSSITWNGSKVLNPITGEATEGQTTLISDSATSVIWQTANGTSIQFNVVEVVGQWTNVSANGQIIYEISNADTRGNITFIKTAGVVRIKLLLINGEEDPVINEMIIDNFQVQ